MITNIDDSSKKKVKAILLEHMIDNSSNELSEEEINEIYNFVYLQYKRMLEYEYSDVSTKQIEGFKKNLFTYRIVEPLKIEGTGRIFRLPLKNLFEVLKLDERRQSIVGELPVPKNPNLIKARRKIRDRGLIPHVFEEAKLDEVLSAIDNRNLIEGIDIIQAIKNPLFRFITTDKPLLSSKMSDIIYKVYNEGYKEAKIVTHEVRDLGTKKLKENANDFAKQVYDVIKNVQKEENVSSFRETVRALNEKNIPTYRGEKWHVNTLQQLQKRWKELGLISDAPKESKKPKL